MNAAIQEWLQAVEEIDPTVLDIGVSPLPFYDPMDAKLSVMMADGKWKQVYRWLAAPDPSTNHYTALMKRQPTTGAWLIHGRHFGQWCREPDSFIWLYGAPGCGKTALASTIIEYCLQRWQNFSGRAVVYFYFDFVETEKRKHENDSIARHATGVSNSSNAYGSLALLSMYEACIKGVCQSTRASLLSVLRDLIDGFTDVYVVLDALDECVERDALLQDIEDIVSWKTGKLHLLVTSRGEDGDIEREMRRLADDENIIELYYNRHSFPYIGEIMRTDPEWKKWETVRNVKE